MPSYVNCLHCPRVRCLPTHPSHAHSHEHSHAHSRRSVSVVICVNVGAWCCTVRACFPAAGSSGLELLQLWLGCGSCISHVAGHVAPVIPGLSPGKGPKHSGRATAPIKSKPDTHRFHRTRRIALFYQLRGVFCILPLLPILVRLRSNVHLVVSEN